MRLIECWFLIRFEKLRYLKKIKFLGVAFKLQTIKPIPSLFLSTDNHLPVPAPHSSSQSAHHSHLPDCLQPLCSALVFFSPCMLMSSAYFVFCLHPPILGLFSLLLTWPRKLLFSSTCSASVLCFNVQTTIIYQTPQQPNCQHMTRFQMGWQDQMWFLDLIKISADNIWSCIPSYVTQYCLWVFLRLQPQKPRRQSLWTLHTWVHFDLSVLTHENRTQRKDAMSDIILDSLYKLLLKFWGSWCYI